jgi:hypothetical protein
VVLINVRESHEGDRAAIALIEPHDGRIESLVLPAAGPSRIELAHLAVYREVSVEHYEIWSYRATLEIDGVERVRIDGSADESDRIIDGIAVIGGREVDDWRELLERKPVTEIKLSFGSGRTIEIQCQHAQLLLHQTLRHVEDWNGPLTS